MGRSPCCSKEGLNRGAWTAMEDRILTEYVKIHGEGQWRNLPKRAGLKRCGKSCRLRWLNYLRPDIKRGNITRDEEELIIRLHKLLGNRWSLIAGRLPGRTDNEIKNYWNTRIGKKVLQNRSKNEQFPTSGNSQIDQHDHKNKESSLILKPTSQSSSLVNANTNVVWTKASKCNRVVLPREQIIQDTMTMGPPPPPVAHFPTDNPPYSESIPQEEKDLSDMTIGFELDEQLLSDLLNTDFSELTNLDTGPTSDTNTCDDHGQNLSPNSSQTPMFPDDNPNNSNEYFRSGACLLDPWEFDWLLG